MSFDTILFQTIYNLTAHSYWFLDAIWVFLASYFPYLLVGYLSIFIFLKENRRGQVYYFSLTALSTILSFGIITEIIRFFLYRPRPLLTLDIQPLIKVSDTGSMPSGHMMLLVPLGLVLWQLDKRSGALFLGATVLVGFSRIAAGVHWPFDILVGLLFGAASFYLIKRLLPAYKNTGEKI